jgi:hypothetical protein
MSTATYCPNCPSVSNFLDFGFSPDFEGLKTFCDKVIGDFRRTETFSRPIEETIAALMEVFKECSVEDWDGTGALPVSEDAVLDAAKLIYLLPSNMTFPMPSITAEPNGEIALEWYRGNRSIFVVSVSGKSEIIYAGLYGTNKTHGIEYFGSSLPPAIISNLKRLYSGR